MYATMLPPMQRGDRVNHLELHALRTRVACNPRVREGFGQVSRASHLASKWLTVGIGATETKKVGKPVIDDKLTALIESLLPLCNPRREKNRGRLPVFIARNRQATCSCSRHRAVLARPARREGAAGAWHVGDGFAIAGKPACGTVYTSCRSRTCARPQVPHLHRCQRYAAHRDPDWRKHPRRYATTTADRCDFIDARIAWPPAAQTTSGPCRS